MKGPSLDAIRKFKEQQERKKREEDEKKIQSKLSTLEHRAAQGDRKAKTELKKIEKIKEEINNQGPSREIKKQPQVPQVPQKAKPAVRVETDFEELMRLAKQNANQTKKPIPAPPPPEIKKVKKKEAPPKPIPPPPPPEVKRVKKKEAPPKAKLSLPQRFERPQFKLQQTRNQYREDEEDDEDDYESDGFVVDEEDDDIQDEVSKTIRSVFHYDRRRCDLREQELDRQYRAIGRVSTFEDLEREERRASRLAAAEDAKALREEEERKRLKKLRLKK